MRLFVPLLALGLSTPVAAQDWVTSDTCNSRTAVIHESVLDAARLAELREEAATYPNSTGRFWTVTAADAPTSYVWGVSNGTNPLVLAIPDAVQSALSDATIVALEFDERYQTAQEAQAAWNEPLDAPLPPQPNYPQDPRVEQWIRNAFAITGSDDPSGIPLDEMMTVMSRGNFVAAVMADPCGILNNGSVPNQARLILAEAVIQGDWVVGLDRYEALIEILDADDGADLADALLHVFAPYFRDGISRAEIETSNALFLRGEIGTLIAWDARFMAELYGDETAQAYLETANAYLIDARNRQFSAALKDALLAGGVFVGIHAWQLPGEDGFLAHLTRSGFTVTRVPLPGEAP